MLYLRIPKTFAGYPGWKPLVKAITAFELVRVQILL
jgi:hypothetical protein